MGLGKIPGGSSRALRLDPFTLPVRFAAHDAAADEATRHVELHRERVVLRRAVRGMRIKLNVPVAAFLGVAIRRAPDGSPGPDHSCIVLEHPLCRSCCSLLPTPMTSRRCRKSASPGRRCSLCRCSDANPRNANLRNRYPVEHLPLAGVVDR